MALPDAKRELHGGRHASPQRVVDIGVADQTPVIRGEQVTDGDRARRDLARTPTRSKEVSAVEAVKN